MSENQQVSQNILVQSKVILDLLSQIKELKPEMQEGLFCTSNKDAFAIAEGIVSGVRKELQSDWVESLDLAYGDILRISESELDSIESLEDLDLPIEDLLEYIGDYDQRAAEWDYSLEDMRRPEFIGIFCMECDEEIGGEDNCPNCGEDD